MLIGYTAASGIHGINEDCNLHAWSLLIRPFPVAVEPPGMAYLSSLGWAVEIERRAEQLDVPAMEFFFELLDEFRAAGHGIPR